MLFEVDQKGNFIVLYVDAIYDELKTEIKRVFGELPTITPATYNGRAIYKQYSFQIDIPLVNPASIQLDNNLEEKPNAISEIERQAKKEYDSINASLVPYTKLEYKSQLNISFTHQSYAKFDRSINLIGTNSHTASKPFVYQEISRYYDFEAENEKLNKDVSTWGRT